MIGSLGGVHQSERTYISPHGSQWQRQPWKGIDRDGSLGSVRHERKRDSLSSVHLSLRKKENRLCAWAADQRAGGGTRVYGGAWTAYPQAQSSKIPGVSFFNPQRCPLLEKHGVIGQKKTHREFQNTTQAILIFWSLGGVPRK